MPKPQTALPFPYKLTEMKHSPWGFWQIALLEYLGCWLYPEFPFPTTEQGQGRLRKGRCKDKTIAEPPEAAKLVWASALRWGRALPPGTTQAGEHQLLICWAGRLVSIEAVLVCSTILFRVRPCVDYKGSDKGMKWNSCLPIQQASVFLSWPPDSGFQIWTVVTVDLGWPRHPGRNNNWQSLGSIFANLGKQGMGTPLQLHFHLRVQWQEEDTELELGK